MEPVDADIRAAQLRYYRQRADEYDSDLYSDPSVLDRFGAILDQLSPTGRTLELACGTGIWTVLLAGRVSALTAIDGSPEMLRLARRRLGTYQVELVETDLFSWVPDGLYDTVFFGFWLSHVPPDQFDRFWAGIATALAPRGRALFVDTGPQEARYELFVESADTPVVERRLRDGSRHRIIKVLHRPDDLVRKLRSLGWDAAVNPVSGTLFAGQATRSSPKGDA